MTPEPAEPLNRDSQPLDPKPQAILSQQRLNVGSTSRVLISRHQIAERVRSCGGGRVCFSVGAGLGCRVEVGGFGSTGLRM